MSTAKFDTLQNRLGTKSVPVDTVIDGSAKAWVNFDGGAASPAIRSGLNVSSITDVGVGRYRVNFAVPLADANYATLVSGRTNSPNEVSAYVDGLFTYTNAAVQVGIAIPPATAADATTVGVAVFR